MRALLAVLAPCLCRLAASAAAPSLLDQGSLLQKSARLDDAPRLDGDVRGSLLLPALARQIPGLDGVLESSNMTMTDLMGMAQQVLLALKDQAFVDLVNNTLKDVAAIAQDFIKAALVRLDGLEADGKNISTAEDAYVLLTGFFKREGEEVTKGLESAIIRLAATKDALPQNLTDLLSTMAINSTDELTSAAKTMVAGFFEGVANSSNTTLCKALRPALVKIKEADAMLNDQVLPAFSQVRGMLPSVGPMVGMMVPEVADTVTDLANATIETAEPILASFGKAFKSEAQTVTQIATVHSHCSLNSGSARSGPGLLLLPLALASWLLLRA